MVVICGTVLGLVIASFTSFADFFEIKSSRKIYFKTIREIESKIAFIYVTPIFLLSLKTSEKVKSISIQGKFTKINPREIS